MPFELPVEVRATLATRSVRLHHYLWHAIRNNWHRFDAAQRARVAHVAPGWVPKKARMKDQVTLDYDAGESFLYMHRQMILAVNRQLAAFGEPALVPWRELPRPDDPDYPVPGRNEGEVEWKSDAFDMELRRRCERVLEPAVLQARPLAWIGTYVETFIHDFMHMRWAEVDQGAMARFPRLDPANPNPSIAPAFDDPSVDWLGHPWSSHVNPVFWKLHGWVDQVIEAWRIARGLDSVTWTDDWVGEGAPHAAPFAIDGALSESPFLADHAHHEHGMDALFRVVNSVPGCTVGFSYALELGLEPPSLQ